MRFDVICEAHGIEHRLTKPNHPESLEGQTTAQWTVVQTNGRVERMNCTTKEDEAERSIPGIGSPDGKRLHYDDHGQLRTHLPD